MNLELLMFASKTFDNDTLEYIARTHANTTLKNHFRKDYSSYHLVDYDPEDGHVRSQQTVQGYANESSWGRGQAWALYGYTMMFRMTGDEKYLEHAEILPICFFHVFRLMVFLIGTLMLLTVMNIAMLQPVQ